MTDQVRPSAPPLPPSSSTGGGSMNTNNRRRRSSTTNDDGDGEAGPDNGRSGARRSRPGNSAARQSQQQQTGDNNGGQQQQQQRRRNNNNRDSRGNGSRRQPPVELAMSFHTATDQPLPPPPPITATSSSSRRLQASASASSTRRALSVGTNQSQPQAQTQTQGQSKKTKKRSSQTSGVAAEEGMETTTASGSNSRSRSSRPPSRSSSGIQEDEDEDIAASNASLSQLVAEANATEAEIERRRSRLAEIRQRSDAHMYELTTQEEAKKIRKLQKTQRKLKERMMRMQQRQQNLDDEAPLDFSGGPPAAKQKTKSNRTASRTAAIAANGTTAAAVGRGSGSSHSEEAIVRRSPSRMTTDSSGTGITNASSKRSKNRNNATAGNQSTQSQQQRQNSATIAAVPAAAATYASGGARSSVAADEALARKLQNEMLKEQEAVRAMEQQFQDEEMARSLAAAEAARMTSLGLSPNDMLDDGNSGRGRSSRGGGCCNTVHRMISCVIMAGCIGVVLFVVFGIVYRSAGGDVESLPPWFRDSWGQGWEGDYGGQNANSSDFQRWRIGRDKKGLKLTLINGLSDDWQNHFFQAIEDWNGATALLLTTVPDNDGPPCEKHTRGMVKTCNGDYGRTDWTGLNELLFENGWIVSSVAMMNENYLRNARDTERQYVMCHELGHAWGLPHRDEIVGNRDLGTCLDYTITPQNNMKPDEIDFSNLQEMYGVVNSGRRRRLRLTVPTPFGDDTEVLHVSQHANRTNTNVNFDAAQSFYSRRRRARVLLHKTEHAEVWEEDLGQGRRLVSTVLLTVE